MKLYIHSFFFAPLTEVRDTVATANWISSDVFFLASLVLFLVFPGIPRLGVFS